MKVCGKCKEEKPLSEFSVNKRNKDGLEYICKVCRSEIRRSRYANLSEEKKVKLRNECKKWREKMSPLEAKEYYRKSYLRHRDYQLAKKRKQYKDNPEFYKNKSKKYREDNKKLVSAKATERARKERNELYDYVVKRSIIQGTELKMKDIPQELVDLKRVQLLIYREIHK